MLDRVRGPRGATSHGGAARPPAGSDAALPGVSVIVAAYAEQAVIAERVANLRALDYPADQLEIIVACDGSPDDTAQRARDAGADAGARAPARRQGPRPGRGACAARATRSPPSRTPT